MSLRYSRPDRTWLTFFLMSLLLCVAILVSASDPASSPYSTNTLRGDRDPFEGSASETGPKELEWQDFDRRSGRVRIEPAIINPFRIATVGSEVGGIIDNICCEPGDFVEHDQILSEISRKRYDLNARKTKERVEYYNIALERADKDKEIKSKLVSLDAASLMDLSRAEAEAEIVEHRVNEARFEYEQAMLDLNSCRIKAPFSGYVVTRHKERFEIVAPLEKILTIADISKVYAVANLPVNVMPLVGKDMAMTFKTPHGKTHVGRVSRIEPAIDPKTDTRRIFVLIDNPQNELQMGNVGVLELE